MSEDGLQALALGDEPLLGVHGREELLGSTRRRHLDYASVSDHVHDVLGRLVDLTRTPLVARQDLSMTDAQVVAHRPVHVLLIEAESHEIITHARQAGNEAR